MDSSKTRVLFRGVLSGCGQLMFIAGSAVMFVIVGIAALLDALWNWIEQK